MRVEEGQRWQCEFNRLSRLQQRTARDLQTAVALLLQRVHRFPGFAIVVDDVDALGDPAAGRARLAEFKTLVAIDRRIGLLDHLHEDVGLRKQLFDLGRGMGIGRRGIVAAERLLLRADHALRGGNVVGECGRGEAEQKHEKQDDGAHGIAPLSMPTATFYIATGFLSAPF